MDISAILSRNPIYEIAAVLAEKIGTPSDLVSGLITLLRDGAELHEIGTMAVVSPRAFWELAKAGARPGRTR